jgi:hypothetical protein
MTAQHGPHRPFTHRHTLSGANFGANDPRSGFSTFSTRPGEACDDNPRPDAAVEIIIKPRVARAGATQAGIDALGYYHERRDDARDTGLGPEHDWSSHAADAFGSMAIGYEDPVVLAKFRAPIAYPKFRVAWFRSWFISLTASARSCASLSTIFALEISSPASSRESGKRLASLERERFGR